MSIHFKDLAFNKFAPLDDTDETKEMFDSILQPPLNRLNRDSYPVDARKTPDVAKILKEYSNADAVVVPSDVQLQPQQSEQPAYPADSTDRFTFNYWNAKLRDLGIEPVYPNRTEFWTEQLQECVELRNARLAGENPDKFYGWPIIMKDALVNNMDNYTLRDIAAAVNGEYPASIQQTFIEWMLADNKALRRDDRKLILDLEQQLRSKRDFIGVQCRIAAINTWSFETVAPVNFLLKWSYGMPRPEEVAWLITNDKIESDVNKKFGGVVAAIKQMGLTRQKDFTAYNEATENGSPTHPSFPAMHSAASTISTWMPALFDLTPVQYEQALLTDYGTAMGRTVAGVHYPMDNIAGLTVGQHIIRQELPAFAANKYGYSANMVTDRLNALKFEWKDFDSKALTIKGVPAREHLKKANEDTNAKNLIGPVMHHY